jgi:hypothetical protein
MRRRASDILCLASLVLACTHEVDRPDYYGTPTAGSIGSSAPMVDDDDESSSGEDDESSSDDGDDGTPADGGSSPSTSATGAPTDDGATDPTGVGDTGSGDPVLDACLDIAVTECETCACNLCLDPLYACQQDVGCVAMRDCAEQTGCAGADCFEPCEEVIYMHGGPFGSSGALAIALSDCLTASCPSCF